jgi:hypothetical protein
MKLDNKYKKLAHTHKRQSPSKSDKSSSKNKYRTFAVVLGFGT